MTSSRTNSGSLSDADKAASDSRPESLEVLCNFWRQQRGATPIYQRGNTILHFVAMHANTIALKKLIENCLILRIQELKPRNARGDTPLHPAAKFGHLKFVEMLLMEKGFGDLAFERNNLGETPLYIAAACGHDNVFYSLKAKVYRRRGATSCPSSLPSLEMMALLFFMLLSWRNIIVHSFSFLLFLLPLAIHRLANDLS
ncbi:hypothetical protein ACSBR1_020784 [Camellia fascicularis]